MKRTLENTGRTVRIIVDNYTAGWPNWSAGASIDGVITPFEVTASKASEAYQQIVERLESSDLLGDRLIPIPERDRKLIKRMLKGIAATWDNPADFPDWRESEYARGQVELVVETCRVITDKEWDEGDVEMEMMLDRVSDWIRAEVWG